MPLLGHSETATMGARLSSRRNPMPRNGNSFPATGTLEELLGQLGNIPSRRVRLKPAPGTATEKDLVNLGQREDRLYELVDGVLVEKAMGFKESLLAIWLGHLLQDFLDLDDLGFVTGPDGAVRLMPRLVRIPD